MLCDHGDLSLSPLRSVIKNFFTKTFLLSDLKTGVKKFSCDICNASFAKANYLNNHKRTHTGWVFSFIRWITNYLIFVLIFLAARSLIFAVSWRLKLASVDRSINWYLHYFQELVARVSHSRRIWRITSASTRGKLNEIQNLLRHLTVSLFFQREAVYLWSLPQDIC